jgi:hypothetical protein
VMAERAFAALMLLAGAACVTPRDESRVIADLLPHGRGDTDGLEAHQLAVLDDHLIKDAYECLPPVEQVFAAPNGPKRTRRIHARQPHYSFFEGPLQYRVGAADGRWLVSVNVVLQPHEGGQLELPDCGLAGVLTGDVVCEGVPYEADPGVEACPGSGRFEAEASRHNLRALVARWSEEAEGYYNRDAARYGLPIHYDFHFSLQGDTARAPVDWRMPLWNSCGRTPYFTALRSGWSIPIVAHEVGHFLGLLDEYEALSGITSLYPKTPFLGSEGSRMGLSMKTDTRIYPLHHYLVLRRYHCEEPRTRNKMPPVLGP